MRVNGFILLLDLPILMSLTNKIETAAIEEFSATQRKIESDTIIST